MLGEKHKSRGDLRSCCFQKPPPRFIGTQSLFPTNDYTHALYPFCLFLFSQFFYAYSRISRSSWSTRHGQNICHPSCSMNPLSIHQLKLSPVFEASKMGKSWGWCYIDFFLFQQLTVLTEANSASHKNMLQGVVTHSDSHVPPVTRSSKR